MDSSDHQIQRDRVYAEYKKESAQARNSLASRAPYLDLIIRRCFPLDRECQILDLGCGDGALLHFLSRAGYINCKGVDISPTQVKAAEQLNVRVEQSDLMQALSLIPDKSLDVVVSLDVIEHLEKKDGLRLISEMERVAREQVVIFTPFTRDKRSETK